MRNKTKEQAKNQQRLFKVIRALENSKLDLGVDNIVPVGEFEQILADNRVPREEVVKCLRAAYPYTQLKKAENGQLFVIVKMNIDFDNPPAEASIG